MHYCVQFPNCFGFSWSKVMTDQLDAGPVPAAQKPELTARQKRRRLVFTWVLIGAMTSGIFAVANFAILVAVFSAGWLTPSAVGTIMVFWPFVCLLEIALQIVPMNVRQQTQGWDVIIDQWTSFLPLTSCVAVLIAMSFGKFGLNFDGWLMWTASLFTAVIEMQLIPIGNKLIAAARGSEETNI